MNDTLDKDLREIEAQLSSLNPTKMPDDMISRMEQAMISWENNLPVEEKIVPFDLTEEQTTTIIKSTPESSDKMPIWGIAAAVALMAGVAGVFMSDSGLQTHNIVEATTESASTKLVSESPVTPPPSPELSRNIVHVGNEGFTYSDNSDEAFEVFRIEYTEKVITRDSEGNSVITEKPCLEHVLVPVPVH